MIRTTISKIYIVFFTLFLIFSCTDPSLNDKTAKESMLATNELPSVEEAKLNYDKLVKQNTAILRTTADERKTRVADKKIFWKGVRRIKVEGIQRLIIPFNLNKEHYFKLPDSSKISYSAASYLIGTKTNSGFEFEVMTKIPDLEYLQSQEYKGYSGKLIFENLLGDFIRGYEVERDGKAVSIVPSTGTSTLRTNTEMCTIIDWYSVSEGYTQYMHTDTWCVGSNAPTFSLGTNEGYSQIGEDISSGIGQAVEPSADSPGSLPFVGKLCAPVNWTNTGLAKSANIIGLGLLAINYETQQILPVELGVACVTIKAYGRNAEQLGTMFAFAYNQARESIDRQIQAGTIPYLHNVIRARLGNEIKTRLQLFEPTAYFTYGQGCLSVEYNTGNYFCFNFKNGASQYFIRTLLS